MPTYEFRCANGHAFDEFHKISDAPKTATCPTCGAEAVRAISGGAGLVFKGSGFYLTDYGKNAHRTSGPTAAGESKGESKGEGKGESKGDPKPGDAGKAKDGGGSGGSGGAAPSGGSAGTAGGGASGGSASGSKSSGSGPTGGSSGSSGTGGSSGGAAA